MILKSKEQGEWAKLINVGADYELDLIRSMLTEYDIPVQTKSRGAGAYTSIFMGLSITGFDIYVPAARLAEAQEILENVQPLDAETEEYMEADFNPDMNSAADTNDMSETECTAENKRDGFPLKHHRILKMLFFLFIVIPALAGLLFELFQILKDAVG